VWSLSAARTSAGASAGGWSVVVVGDAVAAVSRRERVVRTDALGSITADYKPDYIIQALTFFLFRPLPYDKLESHLNTSFQFNIWLSTEMSMHLPVNAISKI
jgi:hypothetical protein